MNPVVLFRRGVDLEDQAEFELVSNYLPTYGLRTEVPAGSLVIGRYSVLPFYLELEKDLRARGSQLINSYRQHQFIADMRWWCEALGDLTPRLYERLQDLPEHGEFVVKGETNSRKHQWNTMMRAHGRREAAEIASRLADDTLIGQQQIYARDYVPLEPCFFKNGVVATGGNGLPISVEHRFFICDQKVMEKGFYWASHSHELDQVPDPDDVPQEFLDSVFRAIGDLARFYVVDIARTADGRWIVIELNDAQMSGLSCCNPDRLWHNMKSLLSNGD